MKLAAFLQKPIPFWTVLIWCCPKNPVKPTGTLWHTVGTASVKRDFGEPAKPAYIPARPSGCRRDANRKTQTQYRAVLAGRSANNVLMSGSRGTGKSSLVKALLHEYAEQGLRLIEVDKSDLVSLPALLSLLKDRPEKFIVFCDDLSFETGDETYKALKTALDGGLSQRCSKVLVYATSNRRHLMPEYMDENIGTTGIRGEIHQKKLLRKNFPVRPFRFVVEFLSVRSKRLPPSG